MKKLAKLLAIVMIITSLASVAVFAESDVTINNRVDQVMARGERPELTDEEKAVMEAIKTRVEELKAEGLSREEIKEALEAEGFELPEHPKGNKPELTEEEKAAMEAIKTRVEELKAEGLSREEIKEALEAEGFELPERSKGDKPELTEEEKAAMEAVKTRVEELKAEGLSREEVREALEAEGFEIKMSKPMGKRK